MGILKVLLVALLVLAFNVSALVSTDVCSSLRQDAEEFMEIRQASIPLGGLLVSIENATDVPEAVKVAWFKMVFDAYGNYPLYEDRVNKMNSVLDFGGKYYTICMRRYI